MDRKEIKDAVIIGDYKEVDNYDLRAITKSADDEGKKLNGLLLYGYETKFGQTNQNGERYTRECLDDFFDTYYKKNKLNIPLTIEHQHGLEALAGRVIVCEVNSVGFYFVCYVPRGLVNYEQIKTLIQEGVLQGLSKEGWASEWEHHYKSNGDFDYTEIKKMDIVAISLVTTPANGARLESAKEIENATKFVKNIDTDNIDDFFV